jgi:uncharacterized membrane protein YhaH (DUF805 family)
MAWLRGRSNRREYWIWVAALFALGVALSFVPGLSNANIGLTLLLLFTQIRRVHDFGRSGWWAVLATVAPVGVMLPLMAVVSLEVAFGLGLLVELAGIVVIGAIAGDPGENRFGAPPPLTWLYFLRGR